MLGPVEDDEAQASVDGGRASEPRSDDDEYVLRAYLELELGIAVLAQCPPSDRDAAPELLDESEHAQRLREVRVAMVGEVGQAEVLDRHFAERTGRLHDGGDGVRTLATVTAGMSVHPAAAMDRPLPVMFKAAPV
jgi:hypothetical protein